MKVERSLLYPTTLTVPNIYFLAHFTAEIRGRQIDGHTQTDTQTDATYHLVAHFVWQL